MRHTYADARDKRRDFWIAFAAWIVINTLVVVLIQLVSPQFGSGQTGTAMGALTATQLVLDLIVVIVLAIFRRYAALGVVTAVAITIWVAGLEVVFYVISIFAGGKQPQFLSHLEPGSIAVTYAFLVAALAVGAASAIPILRSVSKGIR